jgi:hypothetical protein
MFTKILESIGHNIHEIFVFYATIDDWKRLGQSFKTYPTGEKPLQVACATTSRGVACRNLELYTAEFWKAWSARARLSDFFVPLHHLFGVGSLDCMSF